MNPTHAYSVVTADDHEMIGHVLRDVWQQNGEDSAACNSVVGYAENGLQAIALVKAHQPDWLFLDISMPLASGAEIIQDLRRWNPQTPIVVYIGVQAPGLLPRLILSWLNDLVLGVVGLTLEKNRVITPCQANYDWLIFYLDS